jgi:hypothetical protein
MYIILDIPTRRGGYIRANKAPTSRALVAKKLDHVFETCGLDSLDEVNHQFHSY